MQSLMITAIVLLTVAVLMQVGAFVGMFVMSQTLSTKVDALLAESRKMIRPLESIVVHMDKIGGDLEVTGQVAREEALRIQSVMEGVEANVREEVAEVRRIVHDTVEEASDMVMRPLRECSAVSAGLSAGLKALFTSHRKTPRGEEQFPAA